MLVSLFFWDAMLAALVATAAISGNAISPTKVSKSELFFGSPEQYRGYRCRAH